MAFTPTNQLQSDPNVILRSQQHASRLFVDDQFRLLPKLKYLFHVSFSINPKALANIELSQKHKNEINMLVKSIDLPNFSVSTEIMNQYNRKKVVQYNHKYGDIVVKFHDDNISVINTLWQNYYRYYYADPISATSNKAYTRNATKNSSYINSVYGLDNGSTEPFFKYITIYQLARHEYVSYKLINPIVTKWSHNKLDYSQDSSNDFDMTLAYESVAYGSGVIDKDNGPEGFAVEHYDLTPSPLSSGDNSAVTASPTMNNSVSVSANTLSSINTAAKQINAYQNTQVVNNTGLLTSITNSTTSTVSGIQDVFFPVQTTSTATVATQLNTGI